MNHPIQVGLAVDAAGKGLASRIGRDPDYAFFSVPDFGPVGGLFTFTSLLQVAVRMLPKACWKHALTQSLSHT